MLNTIFDFETNNVIWDNVEKIDEFAKLKQTQQSSVWHKEGNVFEHTKLVVKEMQKAVGSLDMTPKEKSILVLSALFHDIGKGETTYLNSMTNDWSSLNHDDVGCEITRRLLKDEEYTLVECISFFVKYHMKPLYVANSYKGIRDTIMLSCSSIYPSICNVKNLILLKTCDCLGAIIDESKGNVWKEKIEFVEQLAKELDCYDKPFYFRNGVSKYEYFNLSTDIYPIEPKKEPCFNAYFLIGNPIPPYNAEIINISEEIINLNNFSNEKKNIAFSVDNLNGSLVEMISNAIYKYNGNIIFLYGDKITPYYLPTTYSMSYCTTKTID